jgi:hypothetical protein
MQPGDRTPIPTVAEAVTRATALVDPVGEDAAVRGLFEAYEDDTRPTTAVEDLAGELFSTADGVDLEGESPAARMAAAAAVWLSTNFDQDSREHVLREAARLCFNGQPPPEVSNWLEAEGVDAR